ncbi:MAG: tetraacyldisaccharide 4'-kinase [Gammaproteobacteria bacterium]|nr:tetraacyldisaccharide 4'-kinase [Gammaproteobacteria bacterium]
MIESVWQQRGVAAWMLYPLSLLFAAIAATRRLLFKLNILKSYPSAVPIIVVGNITVGGSGKTPTVIWLCSELKRLGKNPGIISRGYGGQAEIWPQDVTAESAPQMVGDEAVLLSTRTGCPMVVGPDRVAAAQMLHDKHGVDIIISDDGLQHYRMQRDIELVIIDGKRRFGNRFLMPAGPLREPVRRLKSVDFVINNGGEAISGQQQEIEMRLQPATLYNLKSGEQIEVADFIERFGNSVHAVAGIGNPVRMFNLLSELGFNVTEHPFTDHHPFQPVDLELLPELPIIMTEKDAVKCTQFATENHWALPIEAQLPEGFAEKIIQQLENKHG